MFEQISPKENLNTSTINLLPSLLGLGENFTKYLPAFQPFLLEGLGNRLEYQVRCLMNHIFLKENERFLCIEKIITSKNKIIHINRINVPSHPYCDIGWHILWHRALLNGA